MTQEKHIALLGGSFNPPQVGHVAICSWLLDERGFDRVWVIPCLHHPFGKALVPFEDRIEMCRLAFARFGSRVAVDDVERRLGGVSYTVRTLEYLVPHNPTIRFSLVVGGDVTREANAWKNFGRIRELAEIVTVPRGPASHIPDVSATDIRARVASGRSIEGLVPPEVAAYIAAHRLYSKLHADDRRQRE